MSGYSVVQFVGWDDGSSLLAVPVSWLFTNNSGTFCYFPKTSARKAIRQQTTPRNGWDVHAVKQMSSKTIPTYERALEKEIQALETSGIDSTDDEKRKGKSKRTRKRPARYCSSQEDSDTDAGKY